MRWEAKLMLLVEWSKFSTTALAHIMVGPIIVSPCIGLSLFHPVEFWDVFCGRASTRIPGYRVTVRCLFLHLNYGNGVFQASSPTQLFGETEGDGTIGTRSFPTHYTRTPHESEAVYQGIYWPSDSLRLVYCRISGHNRMQVPSSLKYSKKIL
jgi:hypothetical protein